MAPAGTPEPVIKHLADHLSRALASAEVRDAIRRDAATERDLPTQGFRKFIQEDIERYKGAVTARAAQGNFLNRPARPRARQPGPSYDV